MAILDGSIDKIIREERHNIQKYLKGAKPIIIDSKNVPSWVRDIYLKE